MECADTLLERRPVAPPPLQSQVSDPVDEWLSNLKKSLRSQADFLIAQVTGAVNLPDMAGLVLCNTSAGFVTAAAIEERCANHGWNSSIYEAWAMARADSVLAEARSLEGIQRDALLLYADSRESLSVNRSDAWDAINDARRETYSEPEGDFYDDCDDNCDYFDDDSDDDVD